MAFFDELYRLLRAPKSLKLEGTQALYHAFLAKEITLNHDAPIHPWSVPSYQSFCRVVHPSSVHKRTQLHTEEGMRVFLHAIAHIEFSAVDLALDHCYRFRNLPWQYYADWLEVADDEVRHFKMLETLMQKAGCAYGDYPVHDALFEAAKRSSDLRHRMAVVPRYLEANGLDANPKMGAKIAKSQAPLAKAILEALDVILKEEIDHVKKGDYWFKYACERDGVSEESYFECIETVLPGSSKPKTSLNVEARKAAGFSCYELNRFSKERVCDDGVDS